MHSCDLIDKNFGGTYMASLADENKKYLNRILVSFHANGIIHMTSEGQDGISAESSYTPFSTQSGNWKIRNNMIYATCINFTNSNFSVNNNQQPSTDRYIVKNLYKFTLKNGMLCGSLHILFYPQLTSGVCEVDHFMCKCAKPVFSLKQTIKGYFICA